MTIDPRTEADTKLKATPGRDVNRLPKRSRLRRLFSWQRVRELLEKALGQHESPRKLALSLAVGAFCGMLPFPGHTAIAAGLALVFRLNITAAMAGAWINLPPLVPFTYALAFFLGTFVTGQPLPHASLAHFRDLSHLMSLLRTYAYPLAVGTTIVGLVFAVVSYVVGLRVVQTHRDWRERSNGNTGDNEDAESGSDDPDVP